LEREALEELAHLIPLEATVPTQFLALTLLPVVVVVEATCQVVTLVEVVALVAVVLVSALLMLEALATRPALHRRKEIMVAMVLHLSHSQAVVVVAILPQGPTLLVQSVAMVDQEQLPL
jgi:hypothetical protein